jgi:hypothetical protein
MYADRILELANMLDSPQDLGVQFNMNWVIHPVRLVGQTDCGTTVCVAGLACIIYGQPGDHIISSRAADLLGLNRNDAERLFYPYEGLDCLYEAVNRGVPYSDLTRADAAQALRQLIFEADVAEPAPGMLEAAK